MLSNVDIVRELGKNIAVFPLQEKTIGPFYVNLTASSIAWSRSNGELLMIAHITADGTFSITPRLNDLEKLQKEIDDLIKRIEDLKKTKGEKENAESIENPIAHLNEQSISTANNLNANNSSTQHDERCDSVIQEFDQMIQEKEQELLNKEKQYRSKKLEIEKSINKLEEVVRNQLSNEISEKKEFDFLIIPSHDTGLILTNETVAVTGKFGGLFHAIVKDVSYGRGHIATTLNPGWYGKPLIAVHNHTDNPLLVQLGSRFVKLSFHELQSEATLRPGELGSRSDIVDHLKLYRSTNYSEISDFFSGSGIDLKYLLNTFKSIYKGKYDGNDAEKKILLNEISDEVIKKNYDRVKDRSISRLRRIFKYHLWDISFVFIGFFAFLVLIYLIFFIDKDYKDYLIPISSAVLTGIVARLITKYIDNK